MTDNLLGLVITRAIPKEVLVGLLAGQYRLCGGVIRWATGTEHAGQIVRHLIPVGSQTITDPLFGTLNGMFNIANTSQLGILRATTQTVLQMATGAMVLSGLNLAVSVIGFAIIDQKLRRLENQLNRIEKEVKGIRELLEIDERARLGAALEDLVNAMRCQRLDDRRELLLHAKGDLAPIRLKYKELLSRADSLEVALGYEEYYVLTSLAHSRCLAELGMLGTARQSLENDVTFWKEESKRIAHDLLLGENPERFLFSDFVKDVPVSDLIEWLDFAHGDDKGYEQLDQLRATTTGWYTGTDRKEILRKNWQMMPVVRQNTQRKTDAELEWQLKKVVPSFPKLIARNKVLDGYVGQYQYLEDHDILPSRFEKELANVSPEFHVDGFIILEPSLN
jgi:hypothetical protein